MNDLLYSLRCYRNLRLSDNNDKRNNKIYK